MVYIISPKAWSTMASSSLKLTPLQVFKHISPPFTRGWKTPNRTQIRHVCVLGLLP
jgi:hypothetical protein